MLDNKIKKIKKYIIIFIINDSYFPLRDYKINDNQFLKFNFRNIFSVVRLK